MSYARRVAYNTVAQVLGRVFTTATSIMTVTFLNSSLGPERWGSYVAITTYLGFFSVLADMGLNLLYLREISRMPEKIDEITSKFLGFRLVSAAFVLLAIAPLIATLVPVYRPYGAVILLLALSQFFLTINQLAVSVVQARLMMDRALIADLAGRVAILAGVVAVVTKAPAANRLETAVLVVVVGTLINLLVTYVFVRPMVRFRPVFAWREWPSLFVRVLPMGAMAVLGMIHFKADSVLLTLYRPEVEVGIYGNAYKILEILITLPAMFVGGLFPEMNQLIQKGRDALWPMMQKAFDLLLFAAIPVVVGVVLLAPQLIGLLTRNYVYESAVSLQLLAFAMIPLFLGTLMAHVLLVVEKQKALSVVELVAVAVNIGLNLYLIPRYSYYGAGAATVLSELLTTATTTWLTIRLVQFRPKLYTLGPIVIGTAAMLLVWLLLQRLFGSAWETGYFAWSRPQQAGSLLLVIAAGTAAYLLPFWLFRAFPPVIQQRLRARTA